MKIFFMLCTAAFLIASHQAEAQTPRCVALLESCYLQDSIELEIFLESGPRSIVWLNNLLDYYSATRQVDQFIEVQNEIYERQSVLLKLDWASAVLSAERRNFQPLQEYLNWLRQNRVNWSINSDAQPPFLEYLLSLNLDFEPTFSK